MNILKGEWEMRGFTLIELLITVSIVAVLLVVGVPSYSYVTTTNRMANEINALVSDMQYARSEALKEGVNVQICASVDGQTCSGSSASWQSGWIVYSMATAAVAPLRVKQAFKGTESFVANNSTDHMIFNREGFPQGLGNSGVTFSLYSATNDPKLTRCLLISIVGQMVLVPYTAGTCT